MHLLLTKNLHSTVSSYFAGYCSMSLPSAHEQQQTAAGRQAEGSEAAWGMCWRECR